MLYFIAIIEILIYLFIAPLMRTLIDKNLGEYSFGIAIFFLVFFLLGGLLAPKHHGMAHRREDIFLIPKLTDLKWLLIVAWMLTVIAISFNYELYDRRIGTESVAKLFASINFFQLVIFRSFEIFTPLITSLVILEFYIKRKNNFNLIAISVILIVVIFLLGAGSSRSWIGLIFIMVLILIQNKLPKRVFGWLIFKAFIVSLLVFSLVTLLRLSSGDDRPFNEYASAEILQRVDGLEVISQIIEKYGYSVFSVNASAIVNPVISLIPFLDAAIELKLEALTTVKAVILDEEFQSGLRDVNSFLLLDVYYWGGLFGVALAATIIGFFSKLVDSKVGKTPNWVYQIFLVSLAINLVILERETVSIFISVIRDWLILCGISLIFLCRSTKLNLVSSKE